MRFSQPFRFKTPTGNLYVASFICGLSCNDQWLIAKHLVSEQYALGVYYQHGWVDKDGDRQWLDVPRIELRGPHHLDKEKAIAPLNGYVRR